MTLTKIRLAGGRYEGILEAGVETPIIEAVHMERVIGTARVISSDEELGLYQVDYDLPPTVLADGVQVISLRSADDGEVLDRITLMAGEALDEDIRSELALMREELQMLKVAFRRHCAETDQD